MYKSSGATIRADLNAVVEEANAADKYLIGQAVMPPFGVDAKAATYPKIQIAEGGLMDAVATERARGGSYGQITRKWGTDNYDCVDRGLEEPVDDTDKSDLKRFFNVEATASKLTLRNVKLAHELRVAGAIMNTGNFGAGTNSVVAYTEAAIATIDFPADVLAAIERIADNGIEADTIVLSSAVLNRIKRSKLMKEWVRGSLTGELAQAINAKSIADSFADHGITKCLVGRARYNTGKKGAAKSISNVWGNTYVWVGKTNPGAGSIQDGGAGFTLYWNEEGGLFVTETYRDEKVRSNMVRVRQNTTEKVVDGTAGTLITTQYS